MNTDTIPRPKTHHGRNIKHLREILNVKQEAIAIELDLTQQAVSKLEAKEIIDDETLTKIAEALKVPVEAIKNMSNDSSYNYINTFYDNSHGGYNLYNHYCTFNPIDKIVELYEDKIKLYERLLSEKDKNNK